MEKSELINLVISIQRAEGTEEEIDFKIDKFLENVPDPNAVDYIFSKEYEDLSAEQIVEKALAYKPFLL